MPKKKTRAESWTGSLLTDVLTDGCLVLPAFYLQQNNTNGNKRKQKENREKPVNAGFSAVFPCLKHAGIEPATT